MPAPKKKQSGLRKKKVGEKSRKNPPSEKQKPVPPWARLLNLISDFLTDAECALDMFATVTPALREYDKKIAKEIDKTISLLKKDARKEGATRVRAMTHARTLVKNVRKFTRADAMFRGNALVGLVSRYEEFLTSILKNAYRKDPARATASDRSITYDELLTVDSLDNVVELFIAKEIGNLLRDSHKKQIEKIDSEFKLGLIENFLEFPNLVEIMERRNQLVHAGGIVSKYYLRKCRESGYKKDVLPKEGEELEVSEDYFRASVLCLSELAVRLGYGLAFRLYLDEAVYTNNHLLHEVGFPLLVSEEWELARRVFSFALALPDKCRPEDLWTRLYAVNAALALSQLGRHNETIELLDRYDWSANEPKFRLAVAVLRREWRQAERLMSNMDGKEPLSEDDFRTWPIYKEFRKTKEFRSAFKSVYGKRYVSRLSKEDTDALKRAVKA